MGLMPYTAIRLEGGIPRMESLHFSTILYEITTPRME